MADWWDSWIGGIRGMVGFVGWKRTKSRLRRKKTAPIANSGASCVSRVVYSYLWILATTDPLRLSGGMKANSVGSLKLDNKVKGMMDISLQKERLTSEGKAQAEAGATERRVVATTIRHAAAPRVVVPATATVHAVRPTLRTFRVCLRI